MKEKFDPANEFIAATEEYAAELYAISGCEQYAVHYAHFRRLVRSRLLLNPHRLLCLAISVLLIFTFLAVRTDSSIRTDNVVRTDNVGRTDYAERLPTPREAKTWDETLPAGLVNVIEKEHELETEPERDMDGPERDMENLISVQNKFEGIQNAQHQKGNSYNFISHSTPIGRFEV